jgi:hypothetical protein
MGVRHAQKAGAATAEVAMQGQLALMLEKESMVAPVVWETLPEEAQTRVTVMLARLLAAMIEQARDE